MYYDDDYDFSNGAAARIRYHFCNFEEEGHTFIVVFRWVRRLNSNSTPFFRYDFRLGFGVKYRLHFFRQNSALSAFGKNGEKATHGGLLS